MTRSIKAQIKADRICETFVDDMLKYYHGMENAVPSRVLEKKYDMSDRQIRFIVNAVRMKGVPICSGQTGYYYAKTKDEALATARTLQGMANSLSEAADNMIKFVKENNYESN